MFSFHKPRVYRSPEGCCICRAKSSSSRFTDSRKYETDSMRCFNLKYPRHGEICNACVLLVKRFKRLPAGSNRHWGHVVDARACPGNKTITKYKKYKEDGGNTIPTIPKSNNGTRRTSSSTSTRTSNNANTSNSTSTSTSNSNSNNNSKPKQVQNKSLISEKFSKIFRKNKKGKTANNDSDTITEKKDTEKGKSPESNDPHILWDSHSLPTTPDSLDSDYEDNHSIASLAACSGVEFQTQTRASSYRNRNKTNSISLSPIEVNNAKPREPAKVGSRRRKCLAPRKDRRSTLNDTVKFFDEMEWRKRKSCCGPVYECTVMQRTYIVDMDFYTPCAKHRKIAAKNPVPINSSQKPVAANESEVVQLASKNPVCNGNPTPVLKKHHLFFKRQSENFPHSDLNVINGNPSTSSSSSNNNSCINVSNITTSPSAEIKTDFKASEIKCSTTAIGAEAMGAATKTPATFQSTSSMTLPTVAGATTSTSTASMSRHLSTKIVPMLTVASTGSTTTPVITSKANHFLHKIKADTGKIVKHSLDKINTAVRMKSSDFQDIKHLTKTAEKSYVMSKPAITTVSCMPHTQMPSQPSPAATINMNSNPLPHPVLIQPQPFTTAYLSAACSASSSSSSTKFSDNSSDSGFDENMQDRKSASPLQEDTEKKMLTRPSVQTMFLASGVQIQGQQQNLVLTGNEVAAKILQNRKPHSSGATNLQNTTRSGINVTASVGVGAPVKIAQIVGNGSQSKMRAIYNNNTIQHENGVTTIVPASSLAASTQTAAMNAVAPSTVTITPAPTQGRMTAAATATTTATSSNLSNNNSVSPTSFITTNSNSGNVVGSTHLSNIMGTHLSAITSTNNNNSNQVSSLNQKIILLKAAPRYNNNSSNSSSISSNSNTSTSNSSSGSNFPCNSSTSVGGRANNVGVTSLNPTITCNATAALNSAN